MKSQYLNRTFTINNRIVDPRRALVTTDSSQVGLTAKQLFILAELIDKKGEIVSRNELIELFWDGNFVVGDKGITDAIYKLRKVLGTYNRTPVIKTIPRNGYVIPSHISVDSEQSIGTPTPRMLLATILSATLIVSAIYISKTHINSFDPPINSIAVLPLFNIGSDEHGYIADGIHEEIVTQLASVAELSVVPRTSVLAFKNSQDASSDIARQLGVRNIFEGTFRYSHNEFRISMQLIDAVENRIIWTEHYYVQRGDENIFAAQSSIAWSVACALGHDVEIDSLSFLAASSNDAFDALPFHKY